MPDEFREDPRLQVLGEKRVAATLQDLMRFGKRQLALFARELPAVQPVGQHGHIERAVAERQRGDAGEYEPGPRPGAAETLAGVPDRRAGQVHRNERWDDSGELHGELPHAASHVEEPPGVGMQAPHGLTDVAMTQDLDGAPAVVEGLTAAVQFLEKRRARRASPRAGIDRQP